MAQILLIDDNDIFRSLLKETLIHFGHKVIEANNGREGLKMFTAAGADLIITDLVMPEIEGFEVLMELQKHRPLVKIIVVSGGVRGNALDFLDIAKRLGASKVLAKPFTNDELMSTVNELLPPGVR
jgi:CheY-like chemotaxis protein